MIEIPTVWIERTKGTSRFKLLTFIPLYLKWLFYIFQTTLTKEELMKKKIQCCNNWQKLWL